MLRLLCLSIMLRTSSGLTATDAFVDPLFLQAEVDLFLMQQGGGRAVVDSRIKLPPCDKMSAIEWSDVTRNSLGVTCRGHNSWQVYIPVSRDVENRQAVPSAQKNEVSNPLPKLVHRGDQVFMRVIAKGYEVTVPAIAMADGRMGEAIKARVGVNAPLQEAIVTGAGIVTVGP